jgi:hypothetical protein
MTIESSKSMFLSLFVSACLISSIARAEEPAKCAARNDLAGSCYEVHGRLNAWNGNPPVRIWVVGTHRMLGLYAPLPKDDHSAGAGEIVPKTIGDQVHSFETEIFAEFTVCPFDKDIPGHMRDVCVESARNIRVETHVFAHRKEQVTVSRIADTGLHPSLEFFYEGDYPEN